MKASDFFFISAGVGIWVLVAIWVVLIYQIIKLLSNLRESIKDLNLGVKSVKSGVKLGFFTLLARLLGTKKEGEGDEKKR